MGLEMKNATNLAIDWIEQGLLPDPLIRAGIRHLLKQRLAVKHGRPSCRNLADSRTNL
jgi:hypothetical protein